MANLATLSFAINAGFNATAKCLPPGNGSNFTNVLSNQSQAQKSAVSFQLGFGNSTGNGTKLVTQARMIAPSGNETISFTSGALTDILSNTNVTFANIAGIYVGLVANANGANRATNMTIGNSGANGWGGWFGNATQTWQIEANGVPYAAGSPLGKPVAANSSNELKIVNGDTGNTLTYVIGICGR